jgi:hypothetical protein
LRKRHGNARIFPARHVIENRVRSDGTQASVPCYQFYKRGYFRLDVNIRKALTCRFKRV